MDKLLYFPYINLPQEEWAYKATLYYDEVNVISANSLGINGEDYDQLNRDLFDYGLLKRVYPNEVKNIKIYRLQDEIIKAIELDGNLDSKREQMKSKRRNVVRIHKEKFNNLIFDYLREIGLCYEQQSDNWYHVEESVANLMMNKLVEKVAKLTQSIPSSDNIENVNALVLLNRDTRKEKLETIILDNILPYPLDFSPKKIKLFKEKYEDNLNYFRESIKEKARKLSGYTEKEIIKEETKIALKELEEGVNFVEQKLTESNFKKLKKGTLAGTIYTGVTTILTQSPLPAIGWALGVAQKATNIENEKFSHSMKYIGLLREELKKYAN